MALSAGDSIGRRADEAIAQGLPHVVLTEAETRRFAQAREVRWRPVSMPSASLLVSPGDTERDLAIEHAARVITLPDGQAALDLRPLLAQDPVGIMVDRWLYGRTPAAQDYIRAASRFGDGARLAAAYVLASLAPHTYAQLDISRASWSGDDARERLMVAADALMARGSDVGEAIALALGPWASGDWRGAGRYIEFLSAQPRLYNVEVGAERLLARGVVEQVEFRHGPADLLAHLAGSPVWSRRQRCETSLRLATTCARDWDDVHRAYRPVTVRVSNGEAASVINNGWLGDMTVGGYADEPDGRTWLTTTITHEDGPITVPGWSVVGSTPRLEIRR